MELVAITKLVEINTIKELLTKFDTVNLSTEEIHRVELETMQQATEEAIKEIVQNFSSYSVTSNSEQPISIVDIDARANHLEDYVSDFINNEIASNWTSIRNEIFLNEP